MEKFYLYKKIILISCGILIWASILNFFVNKELFFSILFCSFSLVIFVFVYIINKNALITEKSFKLSAQDSREELQQQATDSQVKDLKHPFKDYYLKIPNNKEVSVIGRFLLEVIANELQMVIGSVYEVNENMCTFSSGYAIPEGYEMKTFNIGDGLIGQVAKEKKSIEIKEILENFPMVSSALGKACPNYLLIIPMCTINNCFAVLELGFFSNLSQQDRSHLDNFIEAVIKKIHE